MLKKRLFGSQNKKFLVMAVLAAVALVFGLVGCGDAENGPTDGGPLTATYKGYAGPSLCTLVITENTARYAAQVGDGYVLTVNLYDSKGTVSNVDGEELTLKPSNTETTFTVVISGTYLTELNGTITWENGETQVGPGPLSEVNPVPTITTTTLPNGTVGTPYSQTLTVTSSTTPDWTIDSGSLPIGLTLSTSGVISGSPTTAGTFNFTVKVTNALYSDTKALSITIGTSGSGGNIAETYRVNYNSGTIWLSDKGLERDLTYFDESTTSAIVGENNITWAASYGIDGDYSGVLENVVTSGGGNFAPGGYPVAGGPWAYLYSGGAKIGIILRINQNGYLKFIIGKKYMGDFLAYDGGIMGFSPTPVFSDIADSVINVSGECNTTGD